MFRAIVRHKMFPQGFYSTLCALLVTVGVVHSTPIVYDGRAALSLSETTFNDLSGAYV